MQIKIIILLILLSTNYITINLEISISSQLDQSITSLGPNNQIIQKIFEGVYAQNNLPGPYMVRYCFTEEVSEHIVKFINDIIPKAAKGSVTDLISIVKQIQEFSKTVPEQTIDCLDRQQEIYALGFKYNIDGSTDFSGLEVHIVTYITLHFLEVHRWTVDLNDKWSVQNYNGFGFAGATYGHKLLNYP